MGRIGPRADQAHSTGPVDIQAGEALYNAHCESCHGTGGVGSKGPELLNVGAAAADFFLSTGRMPLASPNIEPTSHKPYFNPSQIADIVAYINALDVEHGTPGPGILEVTPACANGSAGCPTLSEGNQLFLLNCAQCHDASGAGGMLSHGYVVPQPAPGDTYADSGGHPGRPPPHAQFRPRPVLQPAGVRHRRLCVLPEPHARSRRPRDRQLRAVPEGFVGVIFGLGMLLLVARLIGNRG